MRELAVAIVFSVLVVGGTLLLPYYVGTSRAPQTVALQPVSPELARPPAPPAPPVQPAVPAHRLAQNTAQPAATAGGDREQGRQVYRKCQACHSLEAGKNGVGPSLEGIVGKKAASDPNYAYSPALRASGLSWDVATLDQYLLDPQKAVPGNKMPFPGLKTENERRDVIAYLAADATAAPAATSPPAATPAPGAPAPRGSVSYIPDIRYTLRSGIAEGRMVFIGVGGTIDGQVNPVLSAAEGQVVQLTLINGEGAEHDIVFPEQNAKSPRITGRGSSTTLAFRAERAGDFTYLCSVPGHELAGMKGQFLVTPRPPAQTVVEAIISREATDLPPPIGTRAPQTVRVDLITVELEGRLAEGTTFGYWTFNGKVPGPFLRVRVGDTIEVHLKNAADSSMIHSVDFHAATGPGGGAAATQAHPGDEKTVKFKALVPGIYVYHCATPMVAHHIANGMYGLILVEPEGGLPPVDHELYVMQGEIYTEAAFGQRGSQEFSVEKLLHERPEYFVFNGSVGALSKLHPMKAKVGETVRIFFGVGGPNYTSSFHVIGEIFDRVYSLGDVQSPPGRGVQTVTVPAGGATIVEFKLDVPGNYILVDHALSRMERGLVGILQVEGDPNPEIFEGKVEPGSGH
jgi:nitrite reductase (NO-forming)